MSDRPRVDDNVCYADFMGDRRQVRVTAVYDEMKAKHPGFDGILPDSTRVWGYDHQIISITRRETIR